MCQNCSPTNTVVVPVELQYIYYCNVSRFHFGDSVGLSVLSYSYIKYAINTIKWEGINIPVVAVEAFFIGRSVGLQINSQSIYVEPVPGMSKHDVTRLPDIINSLKLQDTSLC